MKIFSIIPLCLLLISSNVLAQSTLTLEIADKISKEAIKCAQEKNIKISIAIVNSEGNLVLFNRQDNSYVGSIQASIDKAKSSNAFRRPTSAFTESVKKRVELLSIKEIVAVEGGVPITINNEHIGAVGISGGKSIEDDECAKKAVQILK
ncbi:MAG: heme-binding protein [Candidatus Sericytochromatia bacterium]